MSAPAPPPPPSPRVPPAVQLAVVAAVVAVLLPLALRASYHCDEMNAIRHVGLFAAGDFRVPGRPGLLWFALMPLMALPSPQAILLGGRLLSVAAAALSALLLLRLMVRGLTPAATTAAGASATASPGGDPAAHAAPLPLAGALLALAALYLSPNTLAHAFEIRTDTFVLPLQLGLIALLLRPAPPRRAALWAGLMIAAALLFSQKSVYFVAALHAAVAVHALAARHPGLLRRQLINLLVMDAVGALGVAAYYLLLLGLNGWDTTFFADHLGAAASTAFSDYPLDRKARGLWHQALEAPVLYVVLIGGLIAIAARARRHPLLAGVAVFDLALLSTIFVHRGFFHYYVASMEPIHALVGAAALGLLWSGPRRPAVRVPLRALVIAALLGQAVWAGVCWGYYWGTHKGYQQSVMRSVREAFPEPVTVFDGIGLLPGYPQPGFFMTKGGRDAYRAAHPDDGLIRLWTDPPAHVYVHDYMTRMRYLTPAERQFVQTHFLPYRDNVWLLGYRVAVDGRTAEGTTDVEILAPGPYTAWFDGGWSGTVTVAGQPLTHGGTVELPAGTLEATLADASGQGELWLLFGAARVPDADAVDYSMFPILSRKRYQRYDRHGDLTTPPDCPTPGKRKKNKKKKRK